MAPSNIDVVRAVVDAFNRGDFATALEFCTEDVTRIGGPSAPNTQTPAPRPAVSHTPPPSPHVS